MLFSTLSTKTHGLLDYATALTLAVLPKAIGASPKVTALMQGAAAAHAGYALATDYEMGAVRALPMKGHLLLDGIGAAGFIAAAAVMDDEDTATRALLLGLGAYELTATLMTRTCPSVPKEIARRAYPPNYTPPSRSGLKVTGGTGATGNAQSGADGGAASAMRNERGELVAAE